MRKMLLLGVGVLWGGAAAADNSVPGGWEARCRQEIQRLEKEHGDRRFTRPFLSRDRLTFQIRGPEADAGIFVSVGADASGKLEDTPWLDRRGPAPSGKTPEANWFRHSGNQYAMLTVWHTDTSLVPELQRLLDGCMK